MIYVVEIESPNGARASKEYDAPTMRTAWRAMERDLLRYPRFRIIEVREKEGPEIRMFEEAW
jgi:hypothetical protein